LRVFILKYKKAGAYTSRPAGLRRCDASPDCWCLAFNDLCINRNNTMKKNDYQHPSIKIYVLNLQSFILQASGAEELPFDPKDETDEALSKESQDVPESVWDE
jgi:hypothetical protein